MNRTQEILAQQQFERDWKKWQEDMRSLPLVAQQNIRYVAIKDIARGSDGGHGISSSDVNHRLFGIWKSCDKDFGKYLRRCVEMFDEIHS